MPTDEDLPDLTAEMAMRHTADQAIESLRPFLYRVADDRVKLGKLAGTLARATEIAGAEVERCRSRGLEVPDPWLEILTVLTSWQVR
jgi:hypothetical protein